MNEEQWILTTVGQLEHVIDLAIAGLPTELSRRGDKYAESARKCMSERQYTPAMASLELLKDGIVEEIDAIVLEIRSLENAQEFADLTAQAKQ